MTPTFAVPLPALAVEAPTTEILVEIGNGFLFRTNVAQMLGEIQNALGELEPGDFERIEQLFRAARAVRNDCAGLPLFDGVKR